MQIVGVCGYHFDNRRPVIPEQPDREELYFPSNPAVPNRSQQQIPRVVAKATVDGI
jgi:hypothetical protein